MLFVQCLLETAIITIIFEHTPSSVYIPVNIILANIRVLHVKTIECINAFCVKSNRRFRIFALNENISTVLNQLLTGGDDFSYD